MYGMWKDSLRDFKQIHRKVLVFESVYILLSGFLFVPFIAWIFDRFLRASGSGYLVNNEIFRFALNIRGFAAFIILGTLMVLALFVEFGVLVILCQKIYFGHKVSVMDAIVTTMKSIPKIFGIGMINLFLILILLTPLVDSPITDFLFGGLNLNILLLNPILQSTFRTVIFLILAALLILFFSRMIFSLHIIIIKNLSITKAIRESWRLTHKKMFRISVALVTSNVAFFGIVIALLLVFNYLPLWLRLADRYIFLKSATIIFTGYLGFVLTILVIPLNLIVITRLYYEYSSAQDAKPLDDLVLSGSWLAGKFEHWLAKIIGEHKKIFRTLLVILLLLTFLVNTRFYDRLVFMRWHVMIAAHRGDPVQAPENTIPAIEKAIEQAVDFVEIDVQLTNDNVPVLFHDNTLRRIADRSESISDLSLEAVRRIDAGAWFSEEFRQTGIPTLEEAILHVDNRCGLLIDVKLAGDPEIMAKVIVDLIEQYEITDTCLVQSFSPRFLAEVRTLNPDIKIGQILTLSAGNLSKMDVDFYTISQNMLTENFVKSARREGRQIWVWTVNSERNIKTVLSYDINGIITDYPQRVQKIGGFDILFNEQSPVPQLTEKNEITD